VSAAKLAFAVVLTAVLAGGPAFAQGRSESAPGQNKKTSKAADPNAKTRASGARAGVPSACRT